MRQVVDEGLHLVGDRVGDEEADPDDDHEEPDEHRQHGEATREVPALEEGDDRIEDQRDQPCDDEKHQNRAGRVRQRPDREQRDRQHGELDPAGDYGARRLLVRAFARARLVDQLLLFARRRLGLGAALFDALL